LTAWDDLDIPRPDVYLGVGSGSHAEQTARVMLAFEPVWINAGMLPLHDERTRRRQLDASLTER